MAVIEITKDNFEETILNNPTVLIDFWAPWCGPCRGFAPVFERVAEANPDVVFAKVNTDEEQEIAGHFRIRAHYLRDEAEAVRELLAAARLSPEAAARVGMRARAFVEAVRSRQRSHAGMQSFLREYDLSSQEGVLLMCVAEALLRIPDAA